MHQTMCLPFGFLIQYMFECLLDCQKNMLLYLGGATREGVRKLGGKKYRILEKKSR
jgi:hypothetical protein